MVKKTMRIIWRICLGIIAFFALYFFFTFLLTIIPSNRDFQPANDKDGVDLYIISNGVHTDICFALQDASLQWDGILDLSQYQTNKAQINYLSMGWGDKGFYFDTPTWADLSAKTALTAAFLPSATAMHITALTQVPKVGEMIRKTRVTKKQLAKMEAYILDHLQQKDGKAVLIDCCRYDGFDDSFFEAKGHYHLFRTCNTWANQTLKVGGIKTATWAPFDKCILYHFDQ